MNASLIIILSLPDHLKKLAMSVGVEGDIGDVLMIISSFSLINFILKGLDPKLGWEFPYYRLYVYLDGLYQASGAVVLFLLLFIHNLKELLAINY
jgi:hypothetical protein